jgi:hypothetical protein
LSQDRGTLRPVHLNLINNQDCPEPRVTIKRDGFMEEFNRETVVSDLSKLSDAVAERTVDTEIPIYLNVEWRYTWNITIIDTPGLLDPEDVQDDPVDRELLSLNTLELMRKPERIIIAVEDTDVEGGFKMADFVRQVDPALDRTIFVMTKLDKALEVVVQAGGSVALNDYFGRSPRQQTSFWCSFPWGRARSKYNTRDLLLEKTVQMTDADMRALEELQYDRRFLNQFGVRSVRSFLVQLIWRRYQESIPQVLKALQQNKQAAHSELSRVSNMIANLEPYKLRAAASNYVMQFLQTVEKVISGTLSGNPGLNGLTMAQEHSDEQAGPWIDASHQVISFDPDDLGISNAEARLYGGQQFARLLAEFRAVSHTLSVGSFSVSEIATAAGPSKINNTSNMAWAASDLAQKRCQRALMPLVDQLYRRAVFVLGRLADIVEDMIEKQAKQDRAAAADHAGFGGLSGMPSSGFGVASVLQAQIIPVEEYPYFVQHVKVFLKKEKTKEQNKVFIFKQKFRLNTASLLLTLQKIAPQSVWMNFIALASCTGTSTRAKKPSRIFRALQKKKRPLQ